MRKLTYYAVFEPSASGSYCVYWPDLPGCTSWGESLPRAEKMAIEALGLHICLMEQDGDALPKATISPFTEELPDKAIIMPVSVFPQRLKRRSKDCKVR
jgi:predicted RNase H-like HicB family nuclease